MWFLEFSEWQQVQSTKSKTKQRVNAMIITVQPFTFPFHAISMVLFTFQRIEEIISAEQLAIMLVHDNCLYN